MAKIFQRGMAKGMCAALCAALTLGATQVEAQATGASSAAGTGAQPQPQSSSQAGSQAPESGGKLAQQTPGVVSTPGRARSQNAPVTNVTVDGNEAMFATMCALLAAGFEANTSAENWKPMRAQLRERMQRQQGPAVDAVREFYNKHALADSGTMLSQYIWFALVAGPSPKFALTLKRDELPPEVIS